MSGLSPYRAKARAWLTEAALPLWGRAGLDPCGGGFFECLSYAGVGEAHLPKRIRVQARQVYIMSHSHILGLSTEALPAAERGFAFMTQRGSTEVGGFVHLLAPNGSIVDGNYDTYDHAFVLLALAWYFRATGEPDVRHWIDRTLAFLDRTLWDEATSSWHEGLPRTLPRRQNPHMHLLEAFLALYEATGDERFLARARAIVTLFTRYFYRTETGTLAEFFDDSWAPSPGREAHWREPGHHFEWVWLLHEYERLTGTPTTDFRASLLDFARRAGMDPATGLVYDVVWDDGTVHQSSKRCWSQTEALRAFLVTGDTESAARIAEGLFGRYLATEVPGLWIDQFSPSNEPLTPDVPASTLYHLMGAFVALIS